MKSAHRPELGPPVAAFAAKLREGAPEIPLTDMASLFGAPEELLGVVAGRGPIRFKAETFTNAGPELVLEAGRVELEIPDVLRGRWSVDDEGFLLEFPSGEFAPRACGKIAFLRKCFELREMRATAGDITLDFGSDLASRRYTF
ncbi:MAG: hypothetical protein ACYTGN_01205 [Planctomycetota bacterium]|jgi:hypothetical protein